MDKVLLLQSHQVQPIGLNYIQQVLLNLLEEMVCRINFKITFHLRMHFIAHASCVFQNKLWIAGGRTDLYTQYNLLDSYKVADVWYSVDGGKFYIFIFYFDLILTIESNLESNN